MCRNLIALGHEYDGYNIHAHKQVYAVQRVHATCEGLRHAFPVRGRIAGESHILRLAADEYIVGIGGHCSTQVDSIRIYTNKRVSPLLGGDSGGRAYIYEAPSGSEIVGFHGRTSPGVNAIGVVLRGRGLSGAMAQRERWSRKHI